MSVMTSLWWPEDRIQATLCSEYIFNHLPSNILHRIVTPLPWGEGLTSETYLDWILAKAGRLFLILVDIGIPEQIFALVDEPLDDSDLPIAAHRVDRLHLSDVNDPTLHSKFFHAQWRFVVRGIGEGEHVKYTENEGVPVELLRTGTALTRDGVERVVLAGSVCRVYLRTQVTVGGPPHFFDEEEVLDEVGSLKRLSHEHVYSIYGSYYVDNTVCILFSGVYERTLMSFLTDVPQQFKRLSKERRREILVNWPHCLANGLSWLHAHNQVHSGIRPSNIFIDADFRIFLGQFEALDTLLPPVKVDDVESYQYGPPERWVRSVTVQDAGPSRSALPSGGRTVRKQSSRPSRLSFGILKGPHQSDHEAADSRPESILSQGTAIRVVSPGSPSRFSFGPSSSSGSSDGSARKRAIPSMKRPIFYTPSITSSNSSGSSSHQTPLSPVHASSTVIHTWQSHQTSPEASDIFSLGAVTVDIFTHLCKRKISSFAHHRGAKNRTAGRGGGVADCSFHLDRNMAQVTSWITLLDQDAKKQKSTVFQAVRAMLSMSRDMLSKDPAGRPSASQVDDCFSSAIRQLGATNLHCSSQLGLTKRSKSTLPKGREGCKEEAPAHQILDSRSKSATPTPASPSQHLTVYDHSSIGQDGPSPATSTTNFDFHTNDYPSDDTDQEPDQPPWLDPDQALSPAAVNDPTWDYSLTLRGG